MDIVRKAVGKGIERAIESVPGGEFVGGPVKDLIMNAAGLQEEEPDLVKAINDQTKIQFSWSEFYMADLEASRATPMKVDASSVCFSLLAAAPQQGAWLGN